jgi:ssDNA-binding Zn-finger/Zn-ribbon topoisomerase 1
MKAAGFRLETFAAAAPTCPKCAAPMVLRTAMRTQSGDCRFWGCAGFPGCLGNRPLKLNG